MGEALLNWIVVIASFATFIWLTRLFAADLRASGELRRRPERKRRETPAEVEEMTLQEPVEEEVAAHRLRVDYRKGDVVYHTQRATDRRPAFIGTESLPRMGMGILVRHLKVVYEGGGFTVENRDTAKPVEWRSNGATGQLLPGAAMPVEGELLLALGDWTVSCREEA